MAINRDPTFLDGARRAIQQARARGTWWLILLTSPAAIAWGQALQARYYAEAPAEDLGVFVLPTKPGHDRLCWVSP